MVKKCTDCVVCVLCTCVLVRCGAAVKECGNWLLTIDSRIAFAGSRRQLLQITQASLQLLKAM